MWTTPSQTMAPSKDSRMRGGLDDRCESGMLEFDCARRFGHIVRHDYSPSSVSIALAASLSVNQKRYVDLPTYGFDCPVRRQRALRPSSDEGVFRHRKAVSHESSKNVVSSVTR